MNSKNNFCTFYLVRHGETVWNAQHLLQGHGDSPLTANGINQAKDLAKELKEIQFDAIFSSDLLRAKKTAEIINLEHNLAIKTHEALRERSFGHNEGRPVEEVRKLFDEFDALPDQEKPTFKIAESESDEEIMSRFLTYIREIAVAYPGKKVLVVSHGAVFRTFLIKMGFATYNNISHRAVKNGALVIFEGDGVDFFIKETRRIDLTQ